MSPPDLLLHVGYHKTATTWLQNAVFTRANGFPPLLSHREIFDHIVTPHGLTFDTAGVRALLDSRRGQDTEGAVDVMSLEALSGNPFYGGRESDAYAARLADVASGARILITIRAQDRIIASVYMQYVLRGGTASPRRFFDGAQVGGYYGFDPAHFEYHRLVGLYQRLFGSENVLVLPQEMIAADQAEAVRLLASFSGNSVIGDPWEPRKPRGVSYPEATAALLRRVNHLRAGPANPFPAIDLGWLGQTLFRGVGGTVRALGVSRRPVTDYVRQRFAGRYGDSNRQLAAILHHPVDLKGYDGI